MNTLWAEVIKEMFEFLENPKGLSVVIVVLFFMLVLYLAPVAALTWVNWDGNNRVVGAISELRVDIKDLVSKRVASKRVGE